MLHSEALLSHIDNSLAELREGGFIKGNRFCIVQEERGYVYFEMLKILYSLFQT